MTGRTARPNFRRHPVTGFDCAATILGAFPGRAVLSVAEAIARTGTAVSPVTRLRKPTDPRPQLFPSCCVRSCWTQQER